MNKTKHEQTRLEKLYAALLLVVFGGIVLHAPFSVFFGSHFPAYALWFKSWKELLLIVATLLAGAIVTRRGLWHQLAHSWLLRLIAAFAALHFVLLGWQFQGVLPAAAGLMIDLRYLLFFVLVVILVQVWPRYRLVVPIVGAFGAMIVVIFGALQLVLPSDILAHIGYGHTTIEPYLTVDKNPDYIRINSTLRGPNSLGAYLVVVLAVMAALAAKARYRITKTWRRTAIFAVIAACALVALWISYSRSALIGTVAALVIVGLVVYGRQLGARGWAVIAGVVVLGIISVLVMRGSLLVANVVLHNNPTTGAAVTSNEGHLNSLVSSSQRALGQPLGAGIGSTGSASLYGTHGVIVENQYLFTMHEVGWLGLALFAAIYVLVLRRLWAYRDDWLSLAVFASGIGLGIVGMLLPVWADDTVSIIWWGLAAVAIGSGGKYVRHQAK